MTETDAIVGIYGAVDGAAQADARTRAEVARLLPAYRDPDLHWYDDFETWLKRSRGIAESAEPLFPPLDSALNELREIAPKCRMRARRLFAIALATRAFPEMRDPDSELGSLAVGALRVSSLAEKDGQARELYELISDERVLVSADGTRTHPLRTWWDHLIATALEQGLITSETGLRPRPCSGRLVKVPGVAGPVAALKTEFETDEVGFDAATHFIEPTTWKKCMPNFWCEVREIGPGLLPGMTRYHEVVSSDCAHKRRAAFFAETDLAFNFLYLPDPDRAEVAISNYELCDGRPYAGDLIRVDEGTLVVAKIGPGQTPLRITTTKRIKFSYPFSSEALALIMCALGYAEVTADLLCCAATRDEDEGIPFPGVAPPAPPREARLADAPRRRTAAGAPSGECAPTLRQLMQDTTSIWARVLREGAEAIERGTVVGRAGANTPKRDRSEG